MVIELHASLQCLTFFFFIFARIQHNVLKGPPLKDFSHICQMKKNEVIVL